MKKIVTILFGTLIYPHLFAQDSLYAPILEPTNFLSTIYISDLSSNYLSHDPGSVDKKFYEKNKYLVNHPLTNKNFPRYYQIACSFWNFKKNKEAEKMFLVIYRSNIKPVNAIYHSNSDIPGDTIASNYGYGSYSSHYKNEVCIYLTRIYIEEKKFRQALFYLDKAVNRYKTRYTCGTGYFTQKSEYDFLYAYCYEGLRQYRTVINKYLPGCFSDNLNSLINSINRYYSKKEIINYLRLAEKSICCKTDTFQSVSYTFHNWREPNEKIDTIKYYGGTGTIILFNRKIKLPSPRLENNQRVTKEYYVDLFRNSWFYRQLIKDI